MKTKQEQALDEQFDPMEAIEQLLDEAKRLKEKYSDNMKYGVKSKTYSRYIQEFGSHGEARVFALKQRQVWNNATMQIYEIDGLGEDLLVEQFSPTKGTNYDKTTTMTYTDKRLEEFEKKFGTFEFTHKSGHTWDEKPFMDFLETSIQQAEQEAYERGREEGKFEQELYEHDSMKKDSAWYQAWHQAVAKERERIEQEITKVCKYAEDYRNYDMRGVDWHSILHPTDILSSLDKPLTDKDI